MSINIPLNDNYRLSSDKYQWIIEKKRKGKDRKTGEPTIEWRGDSYHPTPTKAVQHYAHMQVRTSEASTLTEALENIDEVVRSVTEALVPYFEVKLIDRDDEKHHWTE